MIHNMVLLWIAFLLNVVTSLEIHHSDLHNSDEPTFSSKAHIRIRRRSVNDPICLFFRAFLDSPCFGNSNYGPREIRNSNSQNTIFPHGGPNSPFDDEFDGQNVQKSTRFDHPEVNSRYNEKRGPHNSNNFEPHHRNFPELRDSSDRKRFDNHEQESSDEYVSQEQINDRPNNNRETDPTKISQDRAMIIVPNRTCPRDHRRDRHGYCRRAVKLRTNYHYYGPPMGRGRPIRYYYNKFVSVPTLSFYGPGPGSYRRKL